MITILVATIFVLSIIAFIISHRVNYMVHEHVVPSVSIRLMLILLVWTAITLNIYIWYRAIGNSIILLLSLPLYAFTAGLIIRTKIGNFVCNKIFHFINKKSAGFVPRPLVIDTNTLIDKKFISLVKNGVIIGEILIPRVVIGELHNLKDSRDVVKANAGIVGLANLTELIREAEKKDYVTVKVVPSISRAKNNDFVILDIARKYDGILFTHDYALKQEAQLRGIPYVDLNNLGDIIDKADYINSLLIVTIARKSKDDGSGIAFLPDQTVIIIKDGAEYVGKAVKIRITDVQINNKGNKFLFGEIVEVIA